jgi:hypothetical protein
VADCRQNSYDGTGPAAQRGQLRGRMLGKDPCDLRPGTVAFSSSICPMRGKGIGPHSTRSQWLIPHTRPGSRPHLCGWKPEESRVLGPGLTGPLSALCLCRQSTVQFKSACPHVTRCSPPWGHKRPSWAKCHCVPSMIPSPEEEKSKVL